MQFKYPGLDVAIVTLVWIVCIPLGIWVAIYMEYVPWYVVAGSVTGLTALGMWFRVISAGYVFGGINILLSIVGILGLLLNGFSPRFLARVAFNAYSAYVAFTWIRSLQDVQEVSIDSDFNVLHTTDPINEARDTAASSPIVFAAAKRGFMVGAVIGLILGLVTAAIIAAYWLWGSPESIFSEDESAILFLTLFGVGPVILGSIACSLGFALLDVTRSFYLSDKTNSPDE